jgi:Zn-finger nucleic acid-binding protein
MSDRNGIEIDYCPQCRGVWLDRGELDKIVERSSEHYSRKENYDEDQRRYGSYDRDRDRDRDHYGPYPHKKKKSFLGDFFDFD